MCCSSKKELTEWGNVAEKIAWPNVTVELEYEKVYKWLFGFGRPKTLLSFMESPYERDVSTQQYPLAKWLSQVPEYLGLCLEIGVIFVILDKWLVISGHCLAVGCGGWKPRTVMEGA